MNKFIADFTTKDYTYLENFYKQMHQNPELSFYEEQTSERLAKELASLNIKVTKNIGGYGIVGVLSNGDGPVIMLRTDMDALPVEEKTGLSYASKARAVNKDGKEVGVMHACGHDVHMTVFLGTARLLASTKDKWKGTIVFVGQPAEERIAGAENMIKDGLFEKFPRPNYALALHTHPTLQAGKVGYCEGYSWAGDEMLDLIVKGISGHGASPHTAIDPILISSHIILALQAIVSREINPVEPAVITVGSIHGGITHNIIPKEVILSLTIRSYSAEVTKHILASIKLKAENIARSFGVPENLLPEMIIKESTPAIYNDPALTNKLKESFINILGGNNVEKLAPEMISEDFALYGLVEPKIPICIFRLGTIDNKILNQFENKPELLPKLHSDKFAPAVEPTIKTGVKAMTRAVIDLLTL
jgi:hippurate hydrolase